MLQFIKREFFEEHRTNYFIWTLMSDFQYITYNFVSLSIALPNTSSTSFIDIIFDGISVSLASNRIIVFSASNLIVL